MAQGDHTRRFLDSVCFCFVSFPSHRSTKDFACAVCWVSSLPASAIPPMNMPAILVVHPAPSYRSRTGWPSTMLWSPRLAPVDWVDAIEHVENINFDVAFVSNEMRSELSDLERCPVSRLSRS